MSVTTMRAAVVTGYGGLDRFELRDLPRPEPGAGQILVRVRAAGVNPLDCKIRQGRMRLFLPARFPLVLGFDIAGEVAAVGPEVTEFEPGDAVFAMLDSRHGGGFAEYAVVSQSAAALKPDVLTFEEAAALPVAALTALTALRDIGDIGDIGGVRRRDHLAVVGAAGGVGHLAVQLGHIFGAHVTAVAGPGRGDFLRRLGADRVVDYTEEDFTTLDDLPDDADGRVSMSGATADSEADPAVFDVIFDAAGVLRFAACELALEPDGIYVTTHRGAGSAVDALRAGLARIIDRADRTDRADRSDRGERGNARHARRAAAVAVRPDGAALAEIANLAAAGRLRPTLAHVYFLDEVAEAHAASETGHTAGKLVLRIDRVERVEPVESIDQGDRTDLTERAEQLSPIAPADAQA